MITKVTRARNGEKKKNLRNWPSRFLVPGANRGNCIRDHALVFVRHMRHAPHRRRGRAAPAWDSAQHRPCRRHALNRSEAIEKHAIACVCGPVVMEAPGGTWLMVHAERAARSPPRCADPRERARARAKGGVVAEREGQIHKLHQYTKVVARLSNGADLDVLTPALDRHLVLVGFAFLPRRVAVRCCCPPRGPRAATHGANRTRTRHV